MSRRSLRRLLVGGGAAACLLLPGAALADSPAAPAAGALPSNPLPLSSAITGSLAANSGGSFRYAQFSYPGDSSTVTLNLTVDNALPLETGAAGFNVYQAGNLIGSSSDTSPTTASFNLISSTPGPVLVQVFDYDGSNGVNFTLSPQGLPAAAASSATTSATSTVATASNAAPSQNLPLGGSAAGTLAGNSGGSFALYSLDYAANGQDTSLSLAVTPADAVTSSAVGFNVFDANGNLITSGQQTDIGTVSQDITNLAPGNYTVQVFNYDPATTVSYVLSQASS
jgi:hypothetical protein